MGYNYFPNNIGHWVVYQVDSLVWDGNNSGFLTTYHFQIKEIIESNFNDNSGRPTQRIERYTRACDTCDWVIKNVWYSNLTKSSAEKVEENNRYIKLIFPVKLNSTWNGNAYNSLGEWDYSYTSVNVNAKVNTNSFDSTATVLQYADSNMIVKDFSTESYAKNVGLIYKCFYHQEIDPTNGKITNGVKYYYSLLTWGN